MNEYQKGIKVTDEAFASINITHHDWHPEWNYTIKPSHQKS